MWREGWKKGWKEGGRELVKYELTSPYLNRAICALRVWVDIKRHSLLARNARAPAPRPLARPLLSALPNGRALRRKYVHELTALVPRQAHRQALSSINICGLLDDGSVALGYHLPRRSLHRFGVHDNFTLNEWSRAVLLICCEPLCKAHRQGEGEEAQREKDESDSTLHDQPAGIDTMIIGIDMR